MNKADLVESLEGTLGDRKTAQTAVDALVDTIMRTVAQGERVIISGFGVFEKRDRAPRTARNPTTGETVPVSRRNVPNFRPGIDFKDIVSGVSGLAESAGDQAASAVRSATEVPRNAVEGVAAKVGGVAGTAAHAVGLRRRKSATAELGAEVIVSAEADAPEADEPVIAEAPVVEATVVEVPEPASAPAEESTPKARTARRTTAASKTSPSTARSTKASAAKPRTTTRTRTTLSAASASASNPASAQSVDSAATGTPPTPRRAPRKKAESPNDTPADAPATGGLAASEGVASQG